MMKRLSRSNVFQRWWKGSLSLALGLAASGASAGEIQWHAASDAKPETAPTAVAAPGRVIASTAPAPVVTMLAPVPLPASSATSPAAPDPFKRVSYADGGNSDTRVIFRAQMSDAPRMLPVGDPTGPEDPPTKKKPDVLPPSHVVSSPVGNSLDCSPGCCLSPPAACNADGCGRFCIDDCCGPPNHSFWASAEYLAWWVKGQTLPVLVTAGNPADALPGALGQPGTTVLYGGGRVADDVRSGARFRAGWWFDDEHTIGIDASFFFLNQETRNFTASSFGAPALFRPFQNVGFTFVQGVGFVPSSPFENAEKVAFPSQLVGAVNVHQTSQLWGYEANLRTNLCNGCSNGHSWTVDAYGGFRSIVLDESLQINESLASLVPDHPGSIAVADQFKTKNDFYGGQLGLNSEYRRGRWFLDLNTRVALGDVHQVVEINGATLTSDPTGVSLSRGGLLAQGSNIGSYSRDRFAVVPEVGLNVGYQVTECLRVFVGYNALYISSVVRPADQIDRRVNPTQIPGGGGTLVGPANPAFTSFHGTDFYAQGLNFGLEFRW
jgi:Putative beta barrel porin-7 (BBP7)